MCCSEQCTRVKTDPENCGRCDKKCRSSRPFCDNYECVEQPGGGETGTNN
jgi:hypothetical protein